MARYLLISILVLCLAGAWISGELVRQHADPHGGGLFARICHSTGGAGFSCAGALESKWSRITIPVPRPTRDLSISVRRVEVPVAFVGLAYFVFMGVWYGVAGGPRALGRAWHRLPLHVALGALPVSVLLVGLMALGAAPWCLWCLVVHAINALLVLAVWRVVATAPSEKDIDDKRPERMAAMTLTTRHAVTTLAIALVTIGGLWLYRRAHLSHQRERAGLLPYKTLVTSLQQDPAFLLREHAAQPRHEFALRPTEASEDDHHQLVVFTDFECPACFCNASQVHDEIVRHFDGRIDVLIRHFPLSRSCNDDLTEDLHPNACGAARAAEAARGLGGREAFREMYRLLFMNRNRLGRELYRELAVQIGLDPDEFAREMDSPDVCDVVGADIALARRLGVSGTPTMFLDGRRVTELCQNPVFWEAMAEASMRQAPLAREE
jgi:protein-disulfide isomerase